MSEQNEECKKHIDKNIIEKFLETSDEYVERDICECKDAFRRELGREPTEKEIELWLLT